MNRNFAYEEQTDRFPGPSRRQRDVAMQTLIHLMPSDIRPRLNENQRHVATQTDSKEE